MDIRKKEKTNKELKRRIIKSYNISVALKQTTDQTKTKSGTHLNQLVFNCIRFKKNLRTVNCIIDSKTTVSLKTAL